MTLPDHVDHGTDVPQIGYWTRITTNDDGLPIIEARAVVWPPDDTDGWEFVPAETGLLTIDITPKARMTYRVEMAPLPDGATVEPSQWNPDTRRWEADR